MKFGGDLQMEGQTTGVVALLCFLGLCAWGYHWIESQPSPQVVSMREKVAAAQERERQRAQLRPLPAAADERTHAESPTQPAPQTPQTSPQVSAYDQQAWAEAQRLAALNSQRRVLYERIQALQGQYQAAWGSQLTWGSQHEEALKADRQYEEALKRGDWDAQRESRPRRLARLRDELASCYDQMAGLYQQDDASYASWCRQVAGDIRAQRIP